MFHLENKICFLCIWLLHCFGKIIVSTNILLFSISLFHVSRKRGVHWNLGIVLIRLSFLVDILMCSFRWAKGSFLILGIKESSKFSCLQWFEWLNRIFTALVWALVCIIKYNECSPLPQLSSHCCCLNMEEPASFISRCLV